MKTRIVYFGVAAALLFSLCGCAAQRGGPTSSAPGQAETKPAAAGAAVSAQKDTTAAETSASVTEGKTAASTAATAKTATGSPGELWQVNCDDFISLRKAANHDGTIGKIPAGETFTLEGWSGAFAKVTYGGKTGYVLSTYIKPADSGYFADALSTVKLTDTYTYEQMHLDIDSLARRYPAALSSSSIGKSEQGRDIPVLKIGSEKAKYRVFIQAAIHGREHTTAWLAMALADYWAKNDIARYGDVCYHIVPMSNPDGVTISQTKTLNDEQQAIYRRDKEKGYTSLGMAQYAAEWKANALGTDLNRNFPSGWEYVTARNAPSTKNYRGTEPFSAAEAKCLRDYTAGNDFDVTISLHTSGSLIYYEYGKDKTANARSKSLAEAVKKVNGYPLEGSSGIDGAGYKDWAIDVLKIPSLTIEVGCGDSPLALRELYSVFARNLSLLPAIARWVQTQN